MGKKSKKLILFIVFILVISILFGCQKKIPEGYSQEFYDDIVKTTQDYINDMKNITKKDIENDELLYSESFSKFCDKYSGDENLTITERKTFDVLVGLTIYFESNIKSYYEDGEAIYNDDLVKEIGKLSDLLETEINSKGIIIK